MRRGIKVTAPPPCPPRRTPPAMHGQLYTSPHDLDETCPRDQPRPRDRVKRRDYGPHCSLLRCARHVQWNRPAGPAAPPGAGPFSAGDLPLQARQPLKIVSSRKQKQPKHLLGHFRVGQRSPTPRSQPNLATVQSEVSAASCGVAPLSTRTEPRRTRRVRLPSETDFSAPQKQTVMKA